MYMTPTDLDKILQQKAAKHPIIQDSSGILQPFSTSTKKQKFDFWLGIVFLLGVLIGTLLVNHTSTEIQQALEIILGGYLKQRQVQSFASIASASFTSLFVLIVLLFFCGFCTIAQPIIFLVPLFRGLGYGFSIGTLYAQHGADAIPYVAVMVLPTMLSGTFLLIASSHVSLRFSINLLHAAMNGSETAGGKRSRRYCVKFLIFTLFCLLIALFDAGICCKFNGLLIL